MHIMLICLMFIYAKFCKKVFFYQMNSGLIASTEALLLTWI